MLYLIRHAQASYLSDNYDQLSDLGIQQAKALGKYLSNTLWIDQKYVGPHKRQKQTAECICEAYQMINKDIPSPTYISELKEHSGPATLSHYKEQLILTDSKCIQWHQESQEKSEKLRENSIKIFEHFIPQWMAGKYDIEGLENFQTFKNTIAKGLDAILRNKQSTNNTALVTSAGTISTIIAQLLQINDTNEIADISFQVYNASITSLALKDGEWTINQFNQVDHLADHMKTVV